MVRVRGVVPQNFLQGVQHPLNFCVDLCHLWEALLCKKILCVPCVLWEDTVCFVEGVSKLPYSKKITKP